MDTIRLGDVTITRVIEIDRSFYPTAKMLPESTKDVVEKHYDWIRPHFFDERTGDIGSRIQSYVVRTPRHTVVIDTGVGNDKHREESPIWNMRQGTYLDDLAAAGVKPEDVDVVITTHLHVDHVGWNTRWVDGRWVPTFPHAKYIMVGEEWEYWQRERKTNHEAALLIDDSVGPIVEAGRATLVDATHRIDDHLTFEPWPGHTPGHSAVHLRTSAGEAVFCGDLMHRVVQVAEPQWNSQFCGDGPRARKSREAFLERYGNSGTLICAAHFPHPGHIVNQKGERRFVPVGV
jgi:glyoxylase-like metal-dependent hydrolase (beta-lactamase superfamily II)